MLVKYLGTVYNADSKELPRTEFLENGLFRITQPKFLNDRNEAKFCTYIDDYSPADLENARKRFFTFNLDLPKEPTKEHLIDFYLKTTGISYSPENFPTLLGFTEYSSVEEYKKVEAENLLNSVEKFNRFILETLSSYIGVFSLAKSPKNELMWTHYANEGKGLAICFNEEHKFFNEFEIKDVSYCQDDRASISLVEGLLRIDGEKYKEFDTFESFNSVDIYEWMIEKGISLTDLTKRLYYTKTKKWAYEEERRMVIPLKLCEEEKGCLVEPILDDNLGEELIDLLPRHCEICLKKIPFEAIDTIFFGYNTSNFAIKEVIRITQGNPELSHLKFKKAKMNFLDEIELIELA